MVKKVPDVPVLVRASSTGQVAEVFVFLRRFTSALSGILNNLSYRVNRLLSVDGQDAMTGPIVLLSVTVSTVPAVASWTGGLIFVSDETGGATVAFSDGTNWRRVQDRVIVS